MILLDGIKVQNEMAEELREYFSEKDIEIAIIQLGDLPESNAYVKQKKKFGERIGVGVSVIKLSEETTTDELKLFIRTLNKSEKYTGIMVLLLKKLKLPDMKEEWNLHTGILKNSGISQCSTHFFLSWRLFQI